MRQIFKDAICLFHPKDIHFFWANYRFCRKSGNDADSRGGGGGGVEGRDHILCVIMT